MYLKIMSKEMSMISNFKNNIFDVGRKYFTEHFFGELTPRVAAVDWSDME
jgi:hypothetical protein